MTFKVYLPLYWGVVVVNCKSRPAYLSFLKGDTRDNLNVKVKPKGLFLCIKSRFEEKKQWSFK